MEWNAEKNEVSDWFLTRLVWLVQSGVVIRYVTTTITCMVTVTS